MSSIELDNELKILLIYGFVYGFLFITSLLYFFKLENKNRLDIKNDCENKLYELNIIKSSNLHNRMKMYETYTEYNISHVGQETPFIVRLKGRNFKSIKLNQEYNNSMILLGSELMKEFHAHTSMVFNDELILIFPASQYHQFNGNCMKLHSIVSSYASSSLTLKLNTLCSFYSLIVNFTKLESLHHEQDNKYDILYYIKWRINKARSINSDIFFIKKQMKETVYSYVKFGLSHIKYNDTFINLFISPILDTDIKLKQLSNIMSS